MHVMSDLYKIPVTIIDRYIVVILAFSLFLGCTNFGGFEEIHLHNVCRKMKSMIGWKVWESDTDEKRANSQKYIFVIEN